MIQTIAHTINLARNALRNIAGPRRSNRWPTIEKHFRAANPTCAACGNKKWLNVHHIKPFHIFPASELDVDNLITLCMGKLECHLRLGHASNFKLFCPDVRKFAANALAHPDKFEAIVKEASEHSKVN